MSIIKREANNLPIEQRQADGYLNATAMCQAAGKRWNNYIRQKSTEEFLEALAENKGVEVLAKNSVARFSATSLIQVFQGGDAGEQGTWIHPQAAIHLAMWLSPQFSVLVTQWVLEWTNGRQTPPAPQPEQKALGPSKRFPEVSQKVFDSLPYLDRLHMAEDDRTELERRQRENQEIWKWR